ncbi:MAG: YrdB family protein [Saprospiraceae bacterium]
MGSHPINLALRFLLELVALISFGVWGWKQTDGWLRFVLALGIPIILAAIWGVFAVPNDPSRSGAAPVVTPGIVRLLLELTFFAFATWCLKDIGFTKTSAIFGIIVIVHYIISYDRIRWLLAH